MRNIIFELQEVLFIFRIISCFFKICSGNLFYTFIRIPFCNCQACSSFKATVRFGPRLENGIAICVSLFFSGRRLSYLQNVKLLTISQEKYSRPDGNPRGQHGFFLLDYDFVIVAEPFCGVILGFCRGAVLVATV